MVFSYAVRGTEACMSADVCVHRAADKAAVKDICRSQVLGDMEQYEAIPERSHATKRGKNVNGEHALLRPCPACS